MKILDRKIDWCDEYDNLPTLEITVDKMPNHDDRRYKVHRFGKNTSYWSELEGVVNFFCHVPNNESGYGGRVFSGLLEDGTEFSCKGPWSSNSSQMNAHFPACVECSIREVEGQFPNLRYGAELLLPMWLEQVRLAGGVPAVISSFSENAELSAEQMSAIEGTPSEFERGLAYSIKRPGMTLKQSQAFKRTRRLIRYALDPEGYNQDRNRQAAIDLIEGCDLKMFCVRCLSEKPVDQSCGCFDNGGQ